MKAVIFDMDGVISDTQSLAAEVESEVLKSHGIDLGPEQVTREYAGTKHSVMFKKEFAKHGVSASVDEAVDMTWKKIFSSQDRIREIPGSTGLIRRLHGEGYTLAVASGSRMEYIRTVLGKLGVTAYFKALVSGYEVENPKPAPDVFLLAAERIGAEPRDCVVIEDGFNGMQAAKAAGMRCIGLVQDNGSYPADVTVRRLSEVPAVLQSTRSRTRSA